MTVIPLRLPQATAGEPHVPGLGADTSVAPLPLSGSDADILAAMVARPAAGATALFDRYHRAVRRILIRILGPHVDLDDLVQDAFITAIKTVDRVVDAKSLGPWLSSIAVFTARAEIRRRARRRFFHLAIEPELPEIAAPVASPEIDEALRTTHKILNQLPAEERIVFALRFIDGMELTELADVCRVSLATIKRRVRSARQRFEKIASRHEELSEWLGRGR